MFIKIVSKIKSNWVEEMCCTLISIINIEINVTTHSNVCKLQYENGMRK